MTTPTPTPTPTTMIVPVSNPAHPSHKSWLQILLTALEAAVSIGPAIVAITDPSEAKLAGELGQVAQAGLDSVQGQ